MSSISGSSEQPLTNPNVNTATEKASRLKKPNLIHLCDQCTYQTKIEHLYRRHVSKHSLDRPFRCPDCALSDYSHSSFADHLMDHQQTKILRCCFCEYKSNIFGMRLHMAKHQAIEPYDCSLCEFSSNHLGSLKAHKEAFHTKKFCCNYCKKVMTKYFLIKHKEKVHGVSIKDGLGEPLVAVKTDRSVIEDHSELTGPGSGTDIEQFDRDAFPLKDLLHLELPIPALMLKRLDLDAVLDSAAMTAGGNQGSGVDTPDVFQNSSLTPQCKTLEMDIPMPLIPKPVKRLLHSSVSDSCDGCASEMLPDPMTPDGDYVTLPEPLIPEPDPFPVSPEPMSPGANNFLPDADCASNSTPGEPTSPNADTGWVLTEPVSPDAFVVPPNPMSADPDLILPELSIPNTGNRSDLTNSYYGNYMIPQEPIHHSANSGMISPKHTDNDTVSYLPQPMSPDADTFEPDSMIEIEEEVDVKPDLDTLMNIVPSKMKEQKAKYHCNDCDFTTAKKVFLRQHAPKHLLDSKFICTDCEFKEPSPYIFAKHLASRRTPSAKLIYCCFCEHTSKDVGSMTSHLEKHKPVKLDDCPKCGTVFPSKHNLREHYRVMHAQKWECSACGKWMSKYSLKKHRLTHLAEKAKWRVSLKEADSRSEEPKGIQNVVGIPAKPLYGCDSCKYRTRLKSLLRRHVVKHLLPGAELICTLCTFMDTSAKKFAAHLETHAGGDSYDCCFCDYSSMAMNNFISHLEVHRSVHFFDCAKCHKSYTQRSALSSHHRAFHSDKHQCPECGKIMTLSKLQLHKKTHQVPKTTGAESNVSVTAYSGNDMVVITPQAMFRCESCKYSTDIESLYTHHIAKHTMEEAYFVCPICQYRDQAAYKFSGHLRTHFNDTPACCFCEYTTTKQKNLSSHLETHRSVHFYDCPNCDKSYKARRAVFLHHRSYHVEKHTCIDCGEVITYHELLEHKKLHGTTMNELLNIAVPNQEVFYDPLLFNCYHCAYTTKYKSLLRRHAVKHLLDARLVCPDCDLKEHHAREFAKHCISCHGGLNCSLCPFTTSDLTYLAGHMETHRPVLLYDCTECLHSCNSLTNLKNHFKKLHVAEHKCSQCEEVLSRYELKEHRLKHRMPSLSVRSYPDARSVMSVSVCDPGSLLCSYCDYSTDIQSLLDRHVAKHETDSDLVCSGCEYSSSNASDFARHLREHQKEKNIYVCCFCDFTTFHRGSFPDHIESHRSIHFYDCPKCETTCSNKGNLKTHYEKFHVIEHVCPRCDAVVTYHKLLMHEDMHAEQENPTYYCDSCPYNTKKKSLIRCHVAKHLNSHIVCPKCQGREQAADVFLLHLETCLKIGTTCCCFCGYATTDASSLIQHLEMHRFGPARFFDCSKCEMSFGIVSKLKEHIRVHHKDKHRCSVCGKVMSYSSLLKHMKLHKESDSELPDRFRCNNCVFTTKKKSLLRLHAPKHLVDNRLSCTLCKFKSNFPYVFVNHLRGHSHGDVISCCFCDYSTVNKHNLAGHVDQHRSVHFHDCWKCNKSYCSFHSLQTHFHKMHVQKHYCQKRIRPLEACYQKMTLYRLQKHQSEMHKPPAKEIPYYVCRGPMKKQGQSALAAEVEQVPMPSASSVLIEVRPDIELD